MAVAANGIAAGDVEQQIDYRSRDEIGVLAVAFQNSIDYLSSAAAAAEAISRGDLSVPVEPRGDRDVLSRSVQHLQRTVQGLIDETHRLTESAKEGALDRRGEASRFQGAFRDLVQGINETLDALQAPMEDNSALAALAAHDLTAGVHGDYRGDHARLKDALNVAVASMRQTVAPIDHAAQTLASSSEELAAVSRSSSPTPRRPRPRPAWCRPPPRRSAPVPRRWRPASRR